MDNHAPRSMVVVDGVRQVLKDLLPRVPCPTSFLGLTRHLPQLAGNGQGLAVAFVLGRLPPQLKAVGPQTPNVDRGQYCQRPETPVASLTLQILVGVGGADVDGVSWLLVDEMAIGRAGDVDLSAGKRLDALNLGFLHSL